MDWLLDRCISRLERGDLGFLAVSLMLLGIGLLIFRGVVYFLNVWVILSQYISLREVEGR